MIAELLTEGEENATTCKQLQMITGMDKRSITERIEYERREKGAPICATCNSKHPGYYLAENKETLRRYCRALQRRESEIAKTREALISLATEL